MKKMKRILAWAGILLLLGLYLVTFLLGVFGSEATRGMFMASVACTVIIPVLFYAMLLIAKLLKGSGGNERQEPKAPDRTKKDGPSSYSKR